MSKPQFVFGGEETPELMIISPDGSKSATISLTNDGVITVNGTPLLLEYHTGYEEITYFGTSVSTVIIWTNSYKTQKIREQVFTYDSGKNTQIVTTYYDGQGTVSKTMTEVLTYNVSNKLASITRSIA